MTTLTDARKDPNAALQPTGPTIPAAALLQGLHATLCTVLLSLSLLVPAAVPGRAEVPTAPTNLMGFRDAAGQELTFALTANLQAGCTIWGTDIYSDDSCLTRAVIHAGMLGDGQTGIVRLRILGPQAGFLASTRNEVRSSSWGAWGGSYEFLSATPVPEDAPAEPPQPPVPEPQPEPDPAPEPPPAQAIAPEQLMNAPHWALVSTHLFGAASGDGTARVTDRYGTRAVGAVPGRLWYEYQADYTLHGQPRRHSVHAEATYAGPPPVIFPDTDFALSVTLSAAYSVEQRGPSFRAGWTFHSFSTGSQAFDFGPNGMGAQQSLFHGAAVPTHTDRLTTQSAQASLRWSNAPPNNLPHYRWITLQLQSTSPQLWGVANAIHVYRYFPDGAAGATDHPLIGAQTGTASP